MLRNRGKTNPSPNRKYRRAREFSYQSRTPHYPPQPEVVFSAGAEEGGRGLDPEDPRSRGDLISRELLSLLRESPEREAHKSWKSKAKICGINVYKGEGRDEVKSLAEILAHFKVMLEYISKVEGTKDAEKKQLFKVNTVAEVAEVLEIDTEGKSKEDLRREIMASLPLEV